MHVRTNYYFISKGAQYFKHAFYLSAPIGLEDVSTYPKLFTTLLASGMWTLEDLKKLAGLNFLRVFREVERVKQNPLFYSSGYNIHKILTQE